MKKQRYFYLIFILLFSFFGLVSETQAADKGAGYTIAPVYPENQVNQHLGYFSLKVTPGQRGQLAVLVQNLSATKTKKILVKPTAATTTDQGQINYSPSNKKKDSSATYILPELFSKQVTVSVAPKTSREVTFEYQIPQNGFKGQILGAIYALDQTSSSNQNKSQFGINSKFAMVVGVQLSQDPSKKVAPKLNLRTVKPAIQNGNATIQLNIQNSQPILFGKLSLNAQIKKLGQQQVILKRKVSNYQMAPNTNFNFNIDAPKSKLTAGNYTALVNAKAGDYTWRLKRNFTISDNQVHKLNQPQTPARNGNMIWYILLAVLLLLVIIVLSFGARTKRRRRH